MFESFVKQPVLLRLQHLKTQPKNMFHLWARHNIVIIKQCYVYFRFFGTFDIRPRFLESLTGEACTGPATGEGSEELIGWRNGISGFFSTRDQGAQEKDVMC